MTKIKSDTNKSEAHFKTAVIGLGMIGGSMAYALKGFKGGIVAGYDIDKNVLKNALSKGAVDITCKSLKDTVKNADLVIIATYPKTIVSIVKECYDYFKEGAVITDICGVKTKIAANISNALPPHVKYVGSHPMAGKEVEGFDNAEASLFNNCGYIVVPTDKSDDQSVELIKSMAKALGATKIAVNTPEKHDEIIAYTSDLMHVAASALCLDFNNEMTLAYTAGAYRDCTRIALINPTLWTELFTENAEHIVPQIDILIKSLEKFKTAIDKKDTDTLKSLLQKVRTNKLDILNR